MSKTDKHLSNFIVGSLLTTTMLSPAYSQTAERASDVQADAVFTETVQQSDARRRNIDNLSSPEAQRNQLLGIDQTIDEQTTQAIAQTNTQQRA